MSNQINVAKALLYELIPGQEPTLKVKVQFNPETLKVSFSNQIVPPTNNATANANGGTPATDQNGTSTTQFVGKGSTKLSVQLWFDVTSEFPPGVAEPAQAGGIDESKDVRRLTQKVAYFITPQPDRDDNTKVAPPVMRFLWGSFLFDGIMESLEESLEFFSPDGLPLRASLNMSLSQQSIQFSFAPDDQLPSGARSGTNNLPSGAPPGTAPLTQAPSGSTLQGLASAQGKFNDWQAIAAANNIENPRSLLPGQLIDMNVPSPRLSIPGRASI